jgi:hypothetical protein
MGNIYSPKLSRDVRIGSSSQPGNPVVGANMKLIKPHKTRQMAFVRARTNKEWTEKAYKFMCKKCKAVAYQYHSVHTYFAYTTMWCNGEHQWSRRPRDVAKAA